ncbi:MAG: OmpA family protein [Thermodesulfobacteriota bacterium]
MRRRYSWQVVGLTLALVMLVPSLGPAASDSCGGKKVEAFELLCDLSSSRGDTFNNQMKLQEMLNQAIPAYDYAAALRSFYTYPFGQDTGSYLNWGPKTYDPASFIAELKKFTRKSGARTSLGPAMAASSDDLGKMPGKKALVIFSDFLWSDGFGDPLAEAKKLAAKYPDLAIYTIGFDDKAEGVKLGKGIAAASAGGKYFDAAALLKDQSALQAMVADIFASPGADSDGDGVCDAQDKCPGTPKGLKVDKVGCPLPVTISLHIEFDTAKHDIRQTYHNQIAEVAKYLTTYPNTTAVVEGHTDSRGGEAYNLKLSQNRAEAVRKYLIEKFNIAPARLKAVGYGLSKPVADNKTDAGMQKNRRVDCVISGAFESK